MKFLIEISVDNVKKSTDSYGLVFIYLVIDVKELSKLSNILDLMNQR